MPITTDVVVVGGGAVGAACARELARSRRSVLVLDVETERGQAWRAAAGMLAPQIEAVEEDALFELGLAGRELYGDLADYLRETTGIDIGLWREGIANVAMDDADVIRLKSKVAWQRQQGHLCDWLEAGEVRERWPWLAPSFGALWAPREGAVDPSKLVAALRADAVTNGARMVQDEVVALETDGDRVLSVTGRRDRYAADQVVLAAGAWTGQIAGLPRPVSVQPMRGQMVALPWPDRIKRAIIYNKDCYLLARGDEALAGSTREYVGFDSSVTSTGLGHILRAATRVCPPLASLEVKRTWAGLRPATPDGRPILGAEPRLQGLWYATGHGRNGILLSGISGVLLRMMIDGETPVQDLSAMRPERFWE